VIERELLFKEGDQWNTLTVQESARNIRNYLLVAVGQIVPVRGTDRNSVIALVVTKDLWSLRTNFS
jgi:outer membrane protein assembly factor BamA